MTEVLYVSTDENDCASGVTAVETAGEDLTGVGATCTAGIRTALNERPIDCVVFGENPLTAQGARLTEVTDLCQEAGVPVVLFTDESYGPSTAKSTEGVADYVRSDAEDAYEHLVDRIRWTTSDGDDGDTEWYETLVESMEDGVIVFDPTGRISYANGAMADVFGLSKEAFDSVRFSTFVQRDVVSEDDAELVGEAVKSVLSEGAEDREVEMTVEPVDGNDPRVVEFQVVPLPGGERGALATVRNVTEYKETESELRETRSKIERLHAVTDEMSVCRSERELFELAVDAADRILDVDVCGVDVVEDDTLLPRAVHGGDYGPFPADEGVGGRALSSGESVLVEDVRDRSGASPVSEARSVLCVPVENNALIRAVSRSPGAFDERDRNLAELLAAHVGESLTRIRVGETLRQRRQDLVAERERLVALFENVPSPVVSYAFEDGRPVIKDANPSFEETFGVDADRVVGDPLRDHVAPPTSDPDDVAAHDFINDVSELDDALQSGRQLDTAVRRRTADGPCDFLLHAGPLNDDGGAGYVIYTDISDQKRRERGLERQTERLDRIGEVVSEDLREQLNEARGYLELAAETRDPEDIAEVKRAHERINRLVGDLQNLADRDLQVDPRHVDVESAATRAWAGVETGAANLSVGDGAVVADPDGLEELFQQLFRNAVDHATDEPLAGDLDDVSELTVRVGTLADREGFFVADTGAGIPPAERENVFDSGYSTSDSAGLGLSVVQRIADAHGWAIGVTEAEGGGSRFEFVVDREGARMGPEATT